MAPNSSEQSSGIPQMTQAAFNKLFNNAMEQYLSPGMESSLYTHTYFDSPPPRLVSVTSSTFQKMPLEIRLKIYEEVIAEERVVEIFVTETLYAGDKSLTYMSMQIPVLLHINRDSRLFALKHYKLSFGCDVDKILHGKPRIYFNFEADIAFFKAHWYVHNSANEEGCYNHLGYLANISNSQKIPAHQFVQRVALPISMATAKNMRPAVRRLVKLPNLREVILVGDEGTVVGNGNSFTAGYVHVLRWKQTYLIDTGDFADDSWAESANNLDAEFKKYKQEHRREKVPQPKILVKCFVKGIVQTA